MEEANVPETEGKSMSQAEMELCARFRRLIKEKRWGNQYMSRGIGVATKTIERYKTAQSVPSVQALLWVAREVPEVSVEWLLTGSGEMFKSPEDAASAMADSGEGIGSRTDEELKSLTSETRDALVWHLIEENRRLARINSALIERLA